MGVDTNTVLIAAVVSEHPAVVTMSRAGLVISLLERIFFGRLAISLLERMSIELSAVATEDRSNKSGGIEATDGVPTTSKE